MIDPLAFLRKLKEGPPPPVTHLSGEDAWIKETVRARLIASWSGEGTPGPSERLIGTEALGELPAALEAGSLFSERRVIQLSDPPPGKKKRGAGSSDAGEAPGGDKRARIERTPLSMMGKNQIKTLEEALERLPRERVRLVIETSSLKKTNLLDKLLFRKAEQVNCSPPKGVARDKWIDLIAKRRGARLEPGLAEQMAASSAPLGVLSADLEKLALAAPEEGEATLEDWRELSQADPEATVWEIGDRLGEGRTDAALAALKTLETQGLSIHAILPSLLSWNQNRLLLKSFRQRSGGGTPEGLHPFVAGKTEKQISGKTLAELRREQRDLLHADRCSKQSWEDPEILLEKFLVEAASGRGR